MLIIAERINATRKSIKQAIADRDVEFIKKEVSNQTACGAHYIDLNAGTFVGQEAECMKWLIDIAQETSELPLSIDSPDPAVIKEVLPMVKKQPIINSITFEKERLEGILPLVKEYNTKVVALCQSTDLTPTSADDKYKVASQLVTVLNEGGIKNEDILVDPLLFPVATDIKATGETYRAMQRIMKDFPGIYTVCGLTNVSYGLPQRKLLNRTFLTAAIAYGMNGAILDPTDSDLMKTLYAARTIAGQDEYCMDFINSTRSDLFE